MWLLILLFLCGTASADVYIITNSQGNVYDISPQPDAVIPSGDARVNLKGQNIQNLQIIPPYQNYNYINGAFSVNTAVVAAQNAAQVAAAQAQIEAQQEAVQAKASAIEKLTDAISKVDTNDVLTNSEMQALLPQ